METVVSSTEDSDLHLLTEWGSLSDRSRTGEAAGLSVLFHVVVITILLLLPAGVSEPERVAAVQRVTPLVAPPELTQRTPNTRKITKEFDSTEQQPRPRIQVPSGAPSTTRPQARRPADFPPAPLPAPPTPLPEAPRLEAVAPKNDLPQIAQAPPQIQPVEQPKLTLENVSPAPGPVTPGRGRVAIPNPSVADAIRQAVRGPSGGLMVGDPDLSAGPGGIGEAVNLPPAPGMQGSQLELLSDPQGVDFRPYLTQVLAAVRRNWMAVIPESVKLGRKGRVGIQFAISKNGGVPKLVITLNSGTDALDRAAVAGISASNPFPPLPSEYKGDRIVLQFNFAYNMPRR